VKVMEEMPGLCRINSEGRRMSAATQEYEMNTKQVFAGFSAAMVLALASPAHAGLLGGSAGGNVGGGLAGNLGGFGGRGLGGAGSFAGQGQMDSAVKTKPVKNTAKSTDQKADNTARSTMQSTGGATAATEAGALKYASGANAAAMATSATPAPAAASPSRTAPAARTPDKSTAHAQPGPSADLMGGTNQTVNAGGHGVAGSNSLDAQHSKGSNSAAAGGSDSFN
jgi:hypothetical protein